MPVFKVIPTLGNGSTGGTGGGGTGGSNPWPNGINATGDSITAGTTNSWFDQVCAAKGVTGNKYAQSGTGLSFAVPKLYLSLPLTQTVPLAAFTGFNDTRVLSGQALRYEHVKAGHRAMAAMQFASHVEQCYSANSNMAFSSGASDADLTHITNWGSRAQWFRANGTPAASYYFTASSVLNSTITFSITGTSVVIGTWGFSSAHPASRIKVTIDGTVILTYDPMNRTDETIAALINDAIVILGLSNTAHTVVLTFLDAGVIAAVDWVGSLKTPAACSTIPLYVLDIIHLVNGVAGAGYDFPSFQTTQAILDGCTSARKSDLLSTFTGYPFVWSKTNDIYVPGGTKTNSDGIHPTDSGGNGQHDIALGVLEDVA